MTTILVVGFQPGAWRDGRVQTIYGGTAEIMKEIVGKSLGLGSR